MPLPESVLENIRNYFTEYRPKEFLFEGFFCRQYFVRSIQNVFKAAINKAKIKKTIGVSRLTTQLCHASAGGRHRHGFYSEIIGS